MENEYNFQPRKHQPLTGKQKAIAVVLILSAVVALIFGFLRMGKIVKEPFELKPLVEEENNNIGDELTALQSKDSDQDGVSDYDETYVYKTSPYNEDSDSDGITDKKEIDSGDNPNCPTGTNCGTTTDPIVENKTTETTPAENTPVIDDILKNNSPEDLSKLQEMVLPPADMSAEDIRNMLRAAGMDETLLSQLTDEQLVASYKSTLENIKK